MKRLFLDTNVILDLLGERQPFYKPIAQLITLADQGKLKVASSPLSLGTVYYFLEKYEGTTVAIDKLRKFKVLCDICKMEENTVEKALNSSFPDFEDALQYFAALDSGCHIIVTRDAKDFKQSDLPVMDAQEFIKGHAELW